MAPPQQLTKHLKKSKETNLISQFYHNYMNYEVAKILLFNAECLPVLAVLILIGEFFLNIYVVQQIPYTEIDWIAYMQECEGFLNGTTDYAALKGDTGPLVYPAGFVYIFSFLYFITSQGQNIKLAQFIFVAIYLLQMYLTLRLYWKSQKVPPYVLVMSAFTSYRIHSIYVLRLFNDPIAMVFLYAAINLFMDRKWTLGSICFSLGISVKMNILLFAPAVLMLYITNLGYTKTIKQLVICALVQFSLGSPFLLTHPLAYLRGSFDIGRVFEHKWTVNYRFLDPTIFENKLFHVSLLVVHLILLGVFALPCYKYLKSYCNLRAVQDSFQPQIDRENARQKQQLNTKKKVKKTNEPTTRINEKFTKDQQNFLKTFENSLKKTATTTSPPPQPIKDQQTELAVNFDKSIQLALLPLFLCNFIGIVCARSLHYQFYVWYFHSLPYLVWSTGYQTSIRLLILGLIEYCWNTYPSTDTSSYLLHCCHVVLLVGIGWKLFKTKIVTDKIL